MDRQVTWAAAAGAMLAAAIVGVVAYNAGVSHGLAMSPALANLPAGAVAPYGWYRPWGFGIGFGPFFLVLFWFLALRMFWGGGFHRRRWSAGDPDGAPPAFEAWHRRMHERMDGQAAAPKS
jgi:hypothetical protein